MRRREIQSFSIKLSDIKEYEEARQARNAEAKKPTQKSHEKYGKIARYEPLNREEINRRIGMENWNSAEWGQGNEWWNVFWSRYHRIIFLLYLKQTEQLQNVS